MSIRWDGTCELDGCRGAAVLQRRCAVHVARGERSALHGQLAHRGVLDLRRVELSAGQFAELVWATRGAATEVVSPLQALLLDGATITDALAIELPVARYASFEQTTFQASAELWLDTACPVRFDGARFTDDVTLHGEVRHHLSFRGAKFLSDARMPGVAVDGVLDLTAARFHGALDLSGLNADAAFVLEGAVVEGPASLSGARLAADPERVRGREAEIDAPHGGWWSELERRAPELALLLRDDQQDLRERYARWPAGAWIRDVTFRASLEMSQATLAGEELAFEQAYFEDRVDLGGARLTARRVRFGRSRFARRFAAAVGGEVLDCRGVDFADGVELDVATDSLVVEHCWFGRPSLIRRGDGVTRLEPLPRVLSLRGSDVARLRLANLDTAAMRLASVSSLDELRIEGPLRFARPPWPWRTRRDMLADEWAWRERHDGWAAPKKARWDRLDPYVDLSPPATLDATEIAALYRALRKGREDEGDQPGAADFYYGEMEMRRRTRGGPAKSILFAYWLTSGYALRPIRAFLTLLAVVAAFAFAFYEVGFADPPPRQPTTVAQAVQAQQTGAQAPRDDALDALVFSAGTATAVLNAPDRPLTQAGDALRVLLRIVGPLLAGLTLLSIRGRVKR